MFVAIYYFKAKEGQEKALLESWSELTKLIYQYRGSLGSRIHSKGNREYIAYAQWPDRNTWSLENPSPIPKADKWRDIMKASCEEINMQHELEVEIDLLKEVVSGEN